MDLNIYGSHDVDICLFGCLQYFFAGHWLPVLLPPAVTVNTGMLSYLLHCVSLCWLFVLLLHLLLSSSQCCLFTAVRTVPSSNCSAVFTANGCKPSPVLTFFTQLPKTDSRARERDGEVAWGKIFKLLQLERFRDFPFSSARFCRTFHRMADPLTLVAYLSSIVRRSFRHWVYLNVYLWTRAVKHRLILPGLFQLIPSPRSHNLL